MKIRNGDNETIAIAKGGYMRWEKTLGTGFLLLALNAGCELDQYTQTKETPEFIISVTHNPAHLRVGHSAKFYVTLRHERDGVSGCKVRFHPAPPSAGSTTEGWIDMVERNRNGVYSAQLKGIEQAGLREMSFSVDCSGIERVVQFAYDVQQT